MNSGCLAHATLVPQADTCPPSSGETPFWNSYGQVKILQGKPEALLEAKKGALKEKHREQQNVMCHQNPELYVNYSNRIFD